MRMRREAKAVVALVGLLLSSCGYNFPGQASALPGGGTTVHVASFSNQTREAGLENLVRTAMEDEILRRGAFELVPEGEAEVVLEGVVRSLQYRPIAFSNTDEALEYETVMTVSASLLDRRRDTIVWRVTNLRESDSFGSVPGTVVAQSSQFQEQSTLNAQNLGQLTDVQLSETQRTEAIERVLENVSRNLYNAMVEDF